MLLTCMIIDDEPLAISLLENYVAKTPFLKLEGSYDSPILALGEINSRPVDLIFLDIQMPELNGLELAKCIPANTRIIFTTAFKQYAYESYQINALEYLLKPVDYQQFLRATNKALQWFEAQHRLKGNTAQMKPGSIFVKCDYKIVRIELDKIAYVSGLKDYVKIYLEGESRSIISLMTMKTAEELLPSNRFIRVHRSYIVAIDKIKAIERGNRIVIGKEYIPVSEIYKDRFMELISLRSAVKK
ncbi:MAG: LytTR family DNA-binding domain-containing protein [Tannerellaceae bacterium]|nr:LytTR family DNA-binding domain-containing protein [Tannerellaceae bacterium]